MVSPLYPTFRKSIDDAVNRIIAEQVTPWSFLTAGHPFLVKTFEGKEISYEGAEFEGSPRTVFWSHYIEPFLEDLCDSEISKAVTMAKDKNVDGRLILPELQDLLTDGCRRVFARMADVDRRLRGKGYPDKVAVRSVDAEMATMMRFIEERIHAELLMLKPSWRVGIRKYVKFAAICLGLPASVYALFGLSGLYRSCTVTTPSYKNEVLQELQNGRDNLAYALVCRNRNWRRPVNFNLFHEEKIAELFAGNQELRRNTRILYEAMASGQKQAEEFRALLIHEKSDPIAIKNLEASLGKTVALADKVGPLIAQYVGGTWEIPPSGMSLEELTDYYENCIIYSAATDSQVHFRGDAFGKSNEQAPPWKGQK